MKEINVRVSDEVYFDLVKQAAEDRKEVNQYVASLAREAVGSDHDNQPYETFTELVRDEFDLSPGGKTSANVLGVAKRMRNGLSWQDAVQDRAKEYAKGNQNIESAEVYEDTVRDSCTRRVGLNTGEFKQNVQKLISEFEGEEPDEGDTSTIVQGWPKLSNGYVNGYVVHINNHEGRIKTFGEDENKDQAEVMADVVNFLIREYNLINRISIPYVVKKKALINNQPTYPDGNERMRHYKELSRGFYLDTHYKKEDKVRRLEELASECNLQVEFEGDW
ncbi:hypothetical protein [Haloparvum sp. PAK95]|uniref:hypothetical protein n=1 Tax=Haloparvum sp. PAK95 TaxID=3418962 RepID=UPI003D2F0B1E